MTELTPINPYYDPDDKGEFDKREAFMIEVEKDLKIYGQYPGYAGGLIKPIISAGDWVLILIDAKNDSEALERATNIIIKELERDNADSETHDRHW